MDAEWTFAELVAQAAAAIATLPPPKNGQVRAVPDERTVRYYVTIGLLDRPLAMRGRTALYGRRHLAQVVAIKRLQSAGKRLAEIQALWSALDDVTLARMSGVALGRRATRRDFWKAGEPAVEAKRATSASAAASAAAPARAALAMSPPPAPSTPPSPANAPVELRVALAPGAHLVIAVPADAPISPADVRALRAAAASLVTELARRGLTSEEP